MQIIQDRRALHRIPETELCLPKTMAYLQNSLKDLKCRVFSPMENALCAWFDFGAQEAIAFRADCDALPIEEKTGLPYASEHPGAMHACGHDGHMSILLELARRLHEKEHLPHNVLLVFQPGEESPGGAKLVCATGVLEKYRVKAIFGLHLWPGLEKGKIFTRKLELMSRSSEVNVDVFGKSAHIGKASEGLDAMAAGVEFLLRVYRMEKEMPEGIFRLLKFGRMESGTVRNAISSHTRLEGSLRAFQDEVFDGLRDGMHQIAAELEQETGCRIQISMSQGYPAVMNPPELVDRVEKICPLELLVEPSMTSEDFACYQKQVPGAFFFLGIGDVPALHSTNFHFDESILLKGADFFEKLAESFV